MFKNLSNFQKLNIYSTLSELYSFSYSHDIAERVEDLVKICQVRSKNEKKTSDVIFSLIMKEVWVTRIVGFLVSILMISLTLLLAVNNYTAWACCTALFGPIIVILSGWEKRKVVLELQKENLLLKSY